MNATLMESRRVISPTLGDITYDEKEVILFSSGIIGYEELTSFIVYEREEFRPFKCLVSLDEPSIFFPVINPKLIDTTFGSKDLKREAKSLGFKNYHDAEIFCIVTIGANLSQATVNLRGPLLMNSTHMIGKQIILVDSNYLLKHPLVINTN
jgi:flagellar assembly factor FliW